MKSPEFEKCMEIINGIHDRETLETLLALAEAVYSGNEKEAERIVKGVKYEQLTGNTGGSNDRPASPKCGDV